MAYKVNILVPNLSPKTVDVSVENRDLVVSISNMVLSMPLPWDAKLNHVRAKVNDEKLCITIPRYDNNLFCLN